MRENLLKKQPTWGLRRAQGSGQKSATPATLTKIILVLLTMLLLPSAAWGVEVIKTITFKQSFTSPVSGTNIDGSDIPVSVSEDINGTTYSYSSSVKIFNGDRQINQYNYDSQEKAVVFQMEDDAVIDNYFSIILPGNYPDTPNRIELTAGYENAVDDEENGIFAKIQVIDIEDNDKIYIGGSATLLETTLNFEKDGTKGNGVDGQTNRDRPGDEMIFVYLNGNSGSPTTFTIKQIVITYETNDYGLTVAGIPVTGVNADDILGDGTVSFTPSSTPATLTLKGANINYESGNVIVSTLTTPLEINLIGNSNINSGSHLPFEGATGNLVFNTSGQDPASLLMDSKATGFSPTSFYTGFNNVSYEGDLYAYLSENNVVIEPATSYGLTIAGVEVTSANLNTETGAITGLDNVTFTPATNTLKLSNAVISGSIYTTLESLIIDITNTNSIATSGSKNGIVSTTNTGTLTFTGTGSLEISSDCSVIRGFTAIEGLNLETKTPYEIYNNGYYRLKDKAAADSTGVKWLKVIQETTYPLWIGGTQVTASNYENVLGNETKTVAFDGVDKLTLSGASIDCQSGDVHYPVTSTIKDLKVNLIKSSTFNILHSYEAFKYAGGENGATLTFSTVDPSDYNNLGSFTIFFENDYVHNPAESNISSGYTIKVSEGETSTEIPNDFNWNWNNNQDTSVSGWMGHKYNAAGAYLKLFYLQVYNLWLSTNRFYYPNGLSPASGITFDPDPSTPTLTYNYGDDSYHVYSGLSELTLKIGCNNESNQANYRMRAVSFGKPNDITATIAEKGNLILAKDDSEGEFRFLGDETSPVISGFTSVTYDDFTILSDGAKYDTEKKQLVDASGAAMTQAIFSTSVILEKPSMTSESAEVGEGVIVTFGNSKDYGTIKYSIDYADSFTGVTDVTDATYDPENKPTVSKPATVTAYVHLNGITSEPSTGKYFGAKQEVFTVAIGDKIEGTSWFTPEIKAEDQIESNFYISEEDQSGIFEMISGNDEYLEAEKSGTTTVYASLWSEEGTTVLNSSNPIALTINVGESLSSVFEGSNTYGALYSETAIQVPEGMSAYVITGIDEEKGTVITSDIDFIPAGVPVLLKNEGEAKAITHIPYTGSATAPTNNKLNYSNPLSPAKPSATDNWYVIYNDNFVKVTAGTEVRGGKCYLNLNGTSAGTRGFYNIGDGEGTTAIREVKSGEVKGEKWADGEWFDLQGRRLNAKPNKSGLYILNGRKVVIK